MKKNMLKKIGAVITSAVVAITSIVIPLPVFTTSLVNVVTIMPTIDFSDWDNETVSTGGLYSGNNKPSGEVFCATDAGGAITVKNRGVADKYIENGIIGLGYTKANNPTYLQNAAALSEGEQMVVSGDVYSGDENNMRFDIKMSGDRDYTPVFSISDGSISIYNGNTEGDAAIVGSFALPYAQWSRVELVYTRKGTVLDGGKCDSLELYVNGTIVRITSANLSDDDGKVIPMTGSIIDAGVEEFVISGGIFDNIGVKHYKNGETFASEEEPIIRTTIVPFIDFNDYETQVTPVLSKADAGTTAVAKVDLSTWSMWEPLFKLQNDCDKTGTVYSEIATKADGVDKYFNGSYNKYSETETSYNVAMRYETASNSGMSSLALKEGEQLVYSLSLETSKNMSLYYATYPYGSTAAYNPYLFRLYQSKLYIFDGTATNFKPENSMGYVQLPQNQWVDVRVVYTAGDGVDNNAATGGVDDTVSVFVGAELKPLIKYGSNSNEYVSANGVNKLAKDFHTARSYRLNFNGNSTFDNFAVTKYLARSESVSVENKSLIGIDHKPNDFTYFHSERVMLMPGLDYEFATLESTAHNSYTIEPAANKQSGSKGDRVILTKGCEDNGFAPNYTVLKVPTYNVVTDYIPFDRKFGYFLIEGRFHISSDELGGNLITLYNNTPDSTEEQTLVSISDGKLYAGNAEREIDVTDKWYHIKTIVNFEKGYYDLILDGELLCEKQPLKEGMQMLSEVRTFINKGTGELQIRDMEVTGLAKEPTLAAPVSGVYDFNITKTSQFIDDNLTRNYLADKVVFHGEGDMVYSGGEKTEYEEDAFVYDKEDREIYVPLSIINEHLGTEITYEDGRWKDEGRNLDISAEARYNQETLLGPVKALSLALGYNSEYYKYGKMVIVASEDIELPESNDDDARPWLDGNFYSTGNNCFYQTELTDVQEISNFVYYDRPTAAQLEEKFDSKNQTHPRIVLTPDKVKDIKDRIKEDTDTNAYGGMYKNWFSSIESSARSLSNYGFSLSYKFNSDDNYRTGSAAKTFVDRMTTLGFAYQLTNDEQLKAACARIVAQKLKVVAGFPDLNYGHAIDPSVWLGGAAIAFDWVYDGISEDDREEIAAGLLDIGLRPMDRVYYAGLPSALGKTKETRGNMGNANHIAKWKSNFIPYSQCGLVAAALAFAEYDRETCFDLLEKTIRNWEYSNLGLYPDGGWLEGKTYLAHSVHVNTAFAFSSLLNVMDDEYNILDAQGVRESMLATVQLSALTGSFSYSDDDVQQDNVIGIGDAMSFYADYYNDDKLAQLRQWKYRVKDTTTRNYLDLVFYNHFNDQTDITDTSKVFAGLDNISYTEGTEIVTVHEDWKDPNATFFAMAGGPTRHYHFHNDGGDFAIAMDGNRWSYEHGLSDYNQGTNYTKYAGRAEGHNTIVINPDTDNASTHLDRYPSDRSFSLYTWTNQKEQSVATVMDYAEVTAGAYTTLDMTQLYEDYGAQRVHRGAWIGNDYNAVIMRDEIEFPVDQDFDGWWFMHTKADCEKIDSNTILLRMIDSKNYSSYKYSIPSGDHNGDGYTNEADKEYWWSENAERLYIQARVKGADSYSLDIMDAVPLASSPQLGEDVSQVSGLKKVAIYYAGSGEIDITVRLSNNLAEVVDTTPISEWGKDIVFKNGEGVRCIYEGEEAEQHYAFVAQYRGDELISINLVDADYDIERGEYTCEVWNLSDDADEFRIYTWERSVFSPLARPIKVRVSDLTIIK